MRSIDLLGELCQRTRELAHLVRGEMGHDLQPQDHLAHIRLQPFASRLRELCGLLEGRDAAVGELQAVLGRLDHKPSGNALVGIADLLDLVSEKLSAAYEKARADESKPKEASDGVVDGGADQGGAEAVHLRGRADPGTV